MPGGGWVANDAPEPSREAAATANVGSQSDRIWHVLHLEGSATTDWLGRAIGITSNQAGARMLDLWYEHRAAVLREDGHCTAGVCARHGDGARHMPQDPCRVHGAVRYGKTSKSRKAALWVVTPVGDSDLPSSLFEGY